MYFDFTTSSFWSRGWLVSISSFRHQFKSENLFAMFWRHRLFNITTEQLWQKKNLFVLYGMTCMIADHHVKLKTFKIFGWIWYPCHVSQSQFNCSPALGFFLSTKFIVFCYCFRYQSTKNLVSNTNWNARHAVLKAAQIDSC